MQKFMLGFGLSCLIGWLYFNVPFVVLAIVPFVVLAALYNIADDLLRTIRNYFGS